MARKFYVPLDLMKLELQNAVLQNLASDPGSPVEGQFYENTTDHTIHFYNGTSFIVLGRLDQLTAPTASLNLNSQKIISLATPTSGTDAATKAYVDAAINGLDWKASVRAATTANGTLASAYVNGSVIDGVTLVTGDRILLKNQTTGAENGVYTVNASGAPTRATDADASAEVTAGFAVFVVEGTTNADTGWVLTTNDAITLGTTALTFAQFSGSTTTAGAGLTSSGSTMNIGANADNSITVNADDIQVNGAVVVKKYSTNVGDGSSTSITVTHNLGTKDVIVQVYDLTTPYAQLFCDVLMTTTNTVTLGFAVAPTTAQFRCVVHA